MGKVSATGKGFMSYHSWLGGRMVSLLSPRLVLWPVAVLTMAAICLVMGLRAAGYELLSVQTDSMAPAIRAGEAVVLQSADRDIKPGEVVSFSSLVNPRVVLTHRVVSVDWDKGTFIARGDSNDMTDRPVPLQNVRGTVSHSVPFAGYVLDALRHPLGLSVTVYIPALGIIVSEVRQLSRHFAGGSGVVRGRRDVHYVLIARAQ